MLTLSLHRVSAQLHLGQTQFARNEIFFNPAYAASKDYYVASANIREQWVGINGSPSTQSFSFFGPIPKKQIGLGLNITNDAIGVTKQQLINLSYAYRINFNNSILSMGMNLGAKTFSIDFEKLNLDNFNDPNLGNSIKRFVPYTGAGVYFVKDNYNIGLSFPIFPQDLLVSGESDITIQDRGIFFLSGAYLSKFHNGLALRTSGLIRGVLGSNMEIDLAGTLFLNDALNFSLIYKSLNALGVQVEYGYDKTYYFSYSFDFATSRLPFNHFGSHEVTLTYYFVPNKKHHFKNPRYF